MSATVGVLMNMPMREDLPKPSENAEWKAEYQRHIKEDVGESESSDRRYTCFHALNLLPATGDRKYSGRPPAHDQVRGPDGATYISPVSVQLHALQP